jgi:hypothetical protein
MVGPFLMAGCRFLLYLVAASAAAAGVTGIAIWSAAALACYIFGLSCLAAKETTPSLVRLWPVFFFSAPIGLALLLNNGPSRAFAFILLLILGIWVGWALRYILGRAEPNIGFGVSRLLAGIALVDLLAVADWPHPAFLLFAFWFLLCLFLQRFVPAT